MTQTLFSHKRISNASGISAEFPRILQNYRALGFALVPCVLKSSGDGKSKEMAVKPPCHSDWRTVDHIDDIADANAWLAMADGWTVLDADSAEAVRLIDAMLGKTLPQPAMIVETHKGNHYYFRKDGDWHCNRRGIGVGLDVIDLASNGVYCAGSWHPVAKRPYSVIRWDPGKGGALSEETLAAAIGSFEGNSDEAAPAWSAYKEGDRDALTAWKHRYGLDGGVEWGRFRAEWEKGRDAAKALDDVRQTVLAASVPAAKKGRHDTLWEVARRLWWDKGIRDRKAIDIAVRVRNAEFGDPLKAKETAYYAYAVGYGNRKDDLEHKGSPSYRMHKRRQAVWSHREGGNRKPPKFDQNEIARLHGEGMTQRAIAEAMGCSQQFAGKVVRKWKRLQAGGGDVVPISGGSSSFPLPSTTSRVVKQRKRGGRPSNRDAIRDGFYGGECDESEIDLIADIAKAAKNAVRRVKAKRAWLDALPGTLARLACLEGLRAAGKASPKETAELHGTALDIDNALEHGLYAWRGSEWPIRWTDGEEREMHAAFEAA